ncbi:MAG: diacylglycerol kinase family lipid kinase [Clostridiales bacterium]|nr:diacylglycerol kinase family lipid kinase [Clostridiales bacterium]
MKYYFVVNPAAGKGNRFEMLIDSIRRVCDNYTLNGQEIDYEVYVTTDVGDAETYVSYCCKNAAMLPVRFYACGGDGTLSEVVNGAVGYENAEVGVIPAGTGNDFVRNFTNQKNFKNIEYQLRGIPQKLDLIQYETNNGVRYSVNMINVGFDGDVAAKVAQIKRNPLIRDGFAYITGIGIVLLSKLGVKMNLTLDGMAMPAREMLQLAVGNGRFYGGGFKAAPKASLDDGMIDLCMVDCISRATFLRLVRSFKNGEHLENPHTKRIVTYKQCREIEIAFDGERDICIDGEIERAEWIRLSSMPYVLNFLVPYDSQCTGLRHAQMPHTSEIVAPVGTNV